MCCVITSKTFFEIFSSPHNLQASLKTLILVFEANNAAFLNCTFSRVSSTAYRIILIDINESISNALMFSNHGNTLFQKVTAV